YSMPSLFDSSDSFRGQTILEENSGVMTKQEFLDSLRAALSSRVGTRAVAENISFYEDYINTQVRMGKSEAQVIEELGDPRLLARSIAEAEKRAGMGSDPEAEYRRADSGYGYRTEQRGSYETGRQGAYGRGYENGQHGAYGYGHASGRQGGKGYRVPLWLVIGIVLLVVVLVLSLVFSVISFLLPILIPVMLVVLTVRLFRRLL
ncbi:MAG: DUF1700 domain-containing protein, partial [Lachnospiraceae bacterium]|nr:DUF1700 domain-containing protein [Lachnospiraceae bacterium]